MPSPGTPSVSAAQNLRDLVMSIRDQIPDLVADPANDGNFITLASLLRFINRAATEICVNIPAIEDWYAIQSEAAMDVYELPTHITGVEQLWYDLWPCWRAPELDALFVSKIQSRSYFFGPHSIHKVPRLHVWPAADRTGQTTTLSSAITATDVTIPLTAVTSFKSYGYVMIDSELILYRTVNASPTNTLTQVLRGQGGTLAAAHTNATTVTERNIFFKCTRLATPVNAIDDIFELPIGLFPLVELYVLSLVRNEEQEFQESRALRTEFRQALERMGAKGAQKQLRQGLQIRTTPPGPLLYMGRLYVP